MMEAIDLLGASLVATALGGSQSALARLARAVARRLRSSPANQKLPSIIPAPSDRAPSASELDGLRDRVFSQHGLGPNDFAVVSFFGLGDAYLLISLLPYVERRLGESKLLVMLQEHHQPLTKLASTGSNVRFAFVSSADAREAIRIFSGHKRDNCFEPGRVYFPHPSLIPGHSLDNIYAIEQFTQLDLYKQLLHLPLTTTPDFYRHVNWPWPVAARRDKRSVLLCPFANSFAPPPLEFWQALATKLVAAGFNVSVNAYDATGSKQFPKIAGTRRLSVPLNDLLAASGDYHWIIGALCGLMNVFSSAGSPNYKTFVIWDDGSGEFKFNPHVHTPSAFPYAYQTKYDGLLHNCDHVVASRANLDESCQRVLRGLPMLSGAGGPAERTVPCYMPTPPGEIVDRISILRVKADRLDGVRRLLALRELEYLDHVLETVLARSPSRGEALRLLDELVELNGEAWQANERIYQTFEDSGWGEAMNKQRPEAMLDGFRNMARAQALNRRRVELKNSCSKLAGNTLIEVKSFDPAQAGLKQGAKKQAA